MEEGAYRSLLDLATKQAERTHELMAKQKVMEIVTGLILSRMSVEDVGFIKLELEKLAIRGGAKASATHRALSDAGFELPHEGDADEPQGLGHAAEAILQSVSEIERLGRQLPNNED